MSTLQPVAPRKRGLPPAPRREVRPALATGDDPPFLRPATRMRVRRTRRGLASRLALGLYAAVSLLVLVVGAWVGVARVMASERLKVSHVKVRGNHFLSEGEVRELVGLSGQENILTLDMQALKGRLRASPWLEDATVRRTLPDTLEIDIGERTPLALAEVDRLYLMDREGDLIDLFGVRTAAYDLPIVRGLKGLDTDARRDRAQRAAAFLTDLAELQAEISEIQVDDGGDLSVVLRGGGEVLRFGPPPCRHRFETFLALRRELVERCPRAEYFDLRFKDRIYAKDAPGLAPVAPPARSANIRQPSPPVVDLAEGTGH
jgi:cell division septal protein FtsQ